MAPLMVMPIRWITSTILAATEWITMVEVDLLMVSTVIRLGAISVDCHVVITCSSHVPPNILMATNLGTMDTNIRDILKT